jgi:hypothetical protein
MFFTVCSRSQQSFNGCVLRDSSQPKAGLHDYGHQLIAARILECLTITATIRE